MDSTLAAVCNMASSKWAETTSPRIPGTHDQGSALPLRRSQGEDAVLASVSQP